MNVQIKDSDRWLLPELHSIQRGDGIGEFSRKVWHDKRKAEPEWFKGFWADLPLWFRQEARVCLGGKFTPKAKPKNLMVSEIMDAINDASEKSS